MMALVVTRLSKRYQGRVEAVDALRGVSFAVPERGICAIVGPSGSGKSTLLAIVGGLDTPSGGEVGVGRLAVHRMSARERARFRATCVGFVFQSGHLVPVLTVAENVALPLALQAVTARERRRRVDAVLSELGLRSMADRRVSELSGGQQQRAAVARALVTNPSLILADEPTAHLDSRTARDVMEVLRAANRVRGTTFVFTTHDPAIEPIASSRVVLRDGLVVTDESQTPWEPCSGSRSATSCGTHAVL